MDKLKGILKLYTVITPVFTLGKPSFFEKIQAVACKCRERKYIPYIVGLLRIDQISLMRSTWETFCKIILEWNYYVATVFYFL